MLILVSFDFCPYVQRAAIALAEKQVPFERRTVDLANRPAWFKAISPLGKVPLLQGDDRAVLFESAAIIEYLEDTRSPALHPADPLERAEHRGWMEFGSSILSDIWIIETTPDGTAFEAKCRSLREKFARLEAVLGEGPYFAGDRFTLVDTVLVPVFRYFNVFDGMVDLGAFTGLVKVPRWRRALAERSSVQGAVVDDYEARLEAFLRRQSSHLIYLSSQTSSKRKPL